MAVFLICLGAVAACAALVFAVETLVAFGLHREEPVTTVYRGATPIDSRRQTPLPTDKAA